jgi:hypothetical protein
VKDNAIVVGNLVVNGDILSARVNLDGNTHDVWYRTADRTLQPRIEPFLTVTLLAGMRTGRAVHADMAASARFLQQIPEIQRIFRRWYADLRMVDVKTELNHDRQCSDCGRVASLFSGGIDSFYTALKHRAELDTLVFVHGFSRRLENPALRKQASVAARAAASRLGLTLVEVDTNAKSFIGTHATWHQYHGALLASVALALTPHFRRVYVPGSLSYDSSFPYGSHPILDPLWSTEETEIIYDGYEANRFEKTAFVVSDETARTFLRVCGNSASTEYNCGWCEKCLRTMVALEIASALRSCPTFPQSLDRRRVASLKLSSPQTWDLWRQNLQAAQRVGSDTTLVRILRLIVDRQHCPAEAWARPLARSLS